MGRVERAHVFVDVLEHARLGLHGRAVEAEDGNAEFLVHIKRNVLAGLGVSPDAVLGAVEGDELDSGMVARKRSIVLRRRPVDARRDW